MSISAVSSYLVFTPLSSLSKIKNFIKVHLAIIFVRMEDYTPHKRIAKYPYLEN